MKMTAIEMGVSIVTEIEMVVWIVTAIEMGVWIVTETEMEALKVVSLEFSGGKKLKMLLQLGISAEKQLKRKIPQRPIVGGKIALQLEISVEKEPTIVLQMGSAEVKKLQTAELLKIAEGKEPRRLML